MSEQTLNASNVARLSLVDLHKALLDHAVETSPDHLDLELRAKLARKLHDPDLSASSSKCAPAALCIFLFGVT